MLTLHPYNLDSTRIVSDRSRFEYDKINPPRNRSRTTTPTEKDHASEITSFDLILQPEKHQHSVAAHLDLLTRRQQPSDHLQHHLNNDEGEFFDDYLEESLLDEKRYDDDKNSASFMPYPESRAQLKVRGPPATTVVPEVPPKDKPRAHFLPMPQPQPQAVNYQTAAQIPSPTREVAQNPNQNNPQNVHAFPLSAPPQAAAPQTATTYFQPYQEVPAGYHLEPDVPAQQTADLMTIQLRQKDFETRLIGQVMNRPLFVVPTRKPVGFNKYQPAEFYFLMNLFLYLFEGVVSVIVIILAAVLAKSDHLGKTGIYQFIIADGSICLFILVLFFIGVVNFEKRNGSFYCVLATVLNFISFIMVVSSVVSNSTCEHPYICRVRKALAAFVIVSVLVWICNLTMFLTTLYISRLNLLEELNFDYSEKGAARAYNETPGPLLTVTGDGLVQTAPPGQPIETDPHIYSHNPPNYRQSSGSNRQSSGPDPAYQLPIVLDSNGVIVDSLTGQRIREFVLNDTGNLLEIPHNNDLRNKNKILVYTVP